MHARQPSLPDGLSDGSARVSPQTAGLRVDAHDDHGAYAALDLGTSNCRLLTALPTATGFRVVDSFNRIVRLGEGMQASGVLADDAMERTIDALRECASRLSRRPLRALRAVATEACRHACNGPHFLKRVRAETGIAFEAISPREEALLALESCTPLLASHARRALLFDIGGGSTELAWVRLDGAGPGPELIGYDSLPIGVVTLSERFGEAVFSATGYEAMLAEVRQRLMPFEHVHRIAQESRQGGVQGMGASGTVTTLAGVAMKLARYRRPLVDGTTLSVRDGSDAIALLRGLGPGGLAMHPCVGPERARYVLPGCAIFQAVQETWPLPQTTVADRGLREGILLRLMREHRPARPRPASRRVPLPA